MVVIRRGGRRPEETELRIRRYDWLDRLPECGEIGDEPKFIDQHHARPPTRGGRVWRDDLRSRLGDPVVPQPELQSLRLKEGGEFIEIH
jgi:hypothetical protein